MSTDLTAAELAAIYEPAFEAAGERPRRGEAMLDYLLAGYGAVPIRRSWWWCIGDRAAAGCQVEDAANACRCWAEDWLLEHGAIDGMTSPIREEDRSRPEDALFFIRVDDGDPGALYEIYAPTIHHVLAAAVIAVAGQNPRLKTPR